MVKNTFAVILGLVVGSAINMGFIELGYRIVPWPGDNDVLFELIHLRT